MLGDADAERHLTRRDVSRPGLDDLAEDDVVDLVGEHARALERARDAAWPSATAGTDERPPPTFVKGVRAALRITEDMHRSVSPRDVRCARRC